MADEANMEDEPLAPKAGGMICERCAKTHGVIFEGEVYWGQCDSCGTPWTYIIETKDQKEEKAA